MKAYCIQLDQAWEDKAANFAQAEALLKQASPDAGELSCPTGNVSYRLQYQHGRHYQE